MANRNSASTGRDKTRNPALSRGLYDELVNSSAPGHIVTSLSACSLFHIYKRNKHSTDLSASSQPDTISIKSQSSPHKPARSHATYEQSFTERTMNHRIAQLARRPNVCNPAGRRAILSFAREHMQRIQDSVVRSFVRRSAEHLSSPDRKIQQCIETIKAEKHVMGEGERDEFDERRARASFEGPCSGKKRPRPTHYPNKIRNEPLPRVERKDASQEKISAGFAKIAAGYGKAARATSGMEMEMRYRRARLMYRYRFCGTMLSELQARDKEHLDPMSNFDYYIWQTAK